MPNLVTHVLLVDDDEEDYIITSDLLADVPGKRYVVTWKDSFESALEALETGKFDVLIFDYRLGGETGIDLLKAVNTRNYPAPVILLTGQHDKSIDTEAIRLGAQDYLIKGRITPDTIERSIRHVIEHYRTLNKLTESNAFLQSIIDALSAEIAIVNTKEEILAVNRAWREAAEALGTANPDASPPTNLSALGHCPAADVYHADTFMDGVRRVILGECADFSLEYPSRTAKGTRWVLARVSRFESADEGFVVIAFEDTTTRKSAEIALEQSRAQLKELSVRDELTRLYNRRHVNEVIHAEYSRMQRHDQPFALLLLDIDHFKAVNDTHGHAAGDEALKHVARICAGLCRKNDCVARYGGEEILFVLPQTPLENALLFAERVRSALEQSDATFDSGDGETIKIPITASIGVAVCANASTTTEQVIAAADAALYTAKAEGRNRVAHTAS